MNKQIAEGWVATTERAESSYGLLVYVAEQCEHGQDIAHSIHEAIACGLLQAVRAERRHTQEQAAREMGVTLSAVAKWESGVNAPRGLYEQAVECYVLGKSSSIS